MELRFGGKFRLVRKIGKGAHSEIYLGVNVLTNEDIAIKIEHNNTRHPQLIYESKIYRVLYRCPGIPKIHWFGIEAESNVLVIDLLGQSLEDLFQTCNKKFTLKTTLLITDQLISLIELIHSKDYIHRHIKPDNFLIGSRSNSSQIFMIDFGIAKRYKSTHRHIPYKENKKFIGTARYASINTHLGIEQSRRDDLESLAYTLIYFIAGKLPWQGLRAYTKIEKYEKLMQKKMSTSIETLTHGLPDEFTHFLMYCRSLRFEDRPDYSYLKRLFRSLSQQEGLLYDNIYDWSVINQTNRSGKPQETRGRILSM